MLDLSTEPKPTTFEPSYQFAIELRSHGGSTNPTLPTPPKAGPKGELSRKCHYFIKKW